MGTASVRKRLDEIEAKLARAAGPCPECGGGDEQDWSRVAVTYSDKPTPTAAELAPCGTCGRPVVEVRITYVAAAKPPGGGAPPWPGSGMDC